MTRPPERARAARLSEVPAYPGRAMRDLTAATTARERFLTLDRYRAEREWKRYEGTPQRDLFRVLRERFLHRHSVSAGWTLEVGPGPGRFSPFVGGSFAQRVLLDLSSEMLRLVPETWPNDPLRLPLPAFVRGDAAHPPLRAGAFVEVVALGNPLGFSGEVADTFLRALFRMVAPGGRLLLESVAGPGEASRYLERLPPAVVGRLLAAPPAAILPRLLKEGFRDEPPKARSTRHGFRRFSAETLLGRLQKEGFDVREVLAVAPCLGFEPERIAAAQRDPKAWAHLVDLEERVGAETARHRSAAALLIAAYRRA